MPTFKLKWSPEDPSNALILTYHSKWEERLGRGNVSVEFRKTGPRNISPECMYLYITSPIKAITAKVSVVRFGEMEVDKATEMASKSLLTPDEIRQYAGHQDHLYFYEFIAFKAAVQPITFQRLASEYGYFPSSNFFPLSQTGRETLDRLGEF